MSRVSEVKAFLDKNSKLPYYHEGLEVQVNIHQGLGDKDGNGFSDGEYKWYNFRIDNKQFGDRRVGFPLAKFVSKIGLSGWNYIDKVSEWVGYDFDSIIGHRNGLTENQLETIISKAKKIKWLRIIRSTGGKGIHIYVPLDPYPATRTRKDHIALSRNILSMLSSILSFDFSTKVDSSGTILWIWSQKQNNQSFSIIKEAKESLRNIPVGRPTVKGIDKLVAILKHTSLDEDHQKLINWLANQENQWWWGDNMLVTHTYTLFLAHKELGMKGVFFTIASGKDLPRDQNCFLFPMKDGAWIVRRHSLGTKEHSYWSTDKSGWTYCYLNRIPTLTDLSPIYEGKQSSKGEWVFNGQENIQEIIKTISPSPEINIPTWAGHRQFTITPLKNSKISIKFNKEGSDPEDKNWLKTKNKWEKVIPIYEEEKDLTPPDELIRHVVGQSEDAGWFIYSNNKWIQEPKHHVKDVLSSLSYKNREANEILGNAVLNPWVLINKPFQPEYPGNRQWNKFSPKFLFTPKKGLHPTWNIIIQHIGKQLDAPMKKNKWCKINSIECGANYILLWIASIFQNPQSPLPYLFLYGPQLGGKSTLHEALILLTDSGIVRAESSLTNPSRFNAELAGSVLCIIEELNLTKYKGAYDRLKDWVTSKTIMIHPKGITPFQLENTTHWIQCANDSAYCPVGLGDTRITMIKVDEPDKLIEREELITKLTEEAPAFLYTVLKMEIPKSLERLRIPVIETEEKKEISIESANLVEKYIIENLTMVKGKYILFKEFVNKFHLWTGGLAHQWSKRRIRFSIPNSKDMPILGRVGGSGDICLGNVSFNKDDTDEDFIWKKNGDRLVKCSNKYQI